jgi:hypothetical protein
MSDVDRDLSETSEDEDFRFFENLQESFAEEKARGGISVELSNGFDFGQNREIIVDQNSEIIVDQTRGIGVDLRSELIESDPNVFFGRKQHSREDFRNMLSVSFSIEVLKFENESFRL